MQDATAPSFTLLIEAPPSTERIMPRHLAALEKPFHNSTVLQSVMESMGQAGIAAMLRPVGEAVSRGAKREFPRKASAAASADVAAALGRMLR